MPFDLDAARKELGDARDELAKAGSDLLEIDFADTSRVESRLVSVRNAIDAALAALTT